MENSKLKTLLLAVILLGMRFDEIYEDKRITTWELLGSVDEVKDTFDAFKGFREAVNEYSGLNDEDKLALVTYFRVKLDISNDATERLIEKGFAWLISTEDFSKEIKLALTN